MSSVSPHPFTLPYNYIHRTFRDTREDPTNVLELTLQGLVEPLNHRLFRRKVIRAGGAEQIHHLCKKWVKTDEEEEGDEPRFPLETLQIVNNLSLDKDVCETFYELGTVEVLCDVINRYELIHFIPGIAHSR